MIKLVSILRYFEKNNINYTAKAFSSYEDENLGLYKPFSTADGWYLSTSFDPFQWWQVQFEKPVEVMSYILDRTRAYPYIVTWSINVSLDGSTWKTIHTKTFSDNEFKGPINLEEVTLIKYFRITQILNNRNDTDLFITYFDCFWKVPQPTKPRALCNKMFFNLWSLIICFNK